MKTIGLIGGMSWESTIPYYRLINEGIKQQLGGLHSAKLLLYSVEFVEIEQCQSNGEWDKSAKILTDAAKKLEAAGADLILICTNTMHKVAPQVQQEIRVPLLHIADAAAEELEQHGITKVGLLGTKYTMKQEFYKQRLIERGIEVVVPEEQEMQIVNDIIFKELCVGEQKEESREKLKNITENLKKKGAQGVVLGCTEIGLLLHQEDTTLRVFDTTRIHAQKAVTLALEE